MQVRHVCEVCGVEEILTPEAAYQSGWDYPPMMGAFGVISPRTCANCPTNLTVWWAITVDGYADDMLTPRQKATVTRILGEPGTVTVSPHDDGNTHRITEPESGSAAPTPESY